MILVIERKVYVVVAEAACVGYHLVGIHIVEHAGLAAVVGHIVGEGIGAVDVEIGGEEAAGVVDEIVAGASCGAVVTVAFLCHQVGEGLKRFGSNEFLIRVLHENYQGAGRSYRGVGREEVGELSG